MGNTMLTVNVKVNRSSSLGPFNPIEAKQQHPASDNMSLLTRLLLQNNCWLTGAFPEDVNGSWATGFVISQRLT